MSSLRIVYIHNMKTFIQLSKHVFHKFLSLHNERIANMLSFKHTLSVHVDTFAWLKIVYILQKRTFEREGYCCETMMKPWIFSFFHIFAMQYQKCWTNDRTGSKRTAFEMLLFMRFFSTIFPTIEMSDNAFSWYWLKDYMKVGHWSRILPILWIIPL